MACDRNVRASTGLAGAVGAPDIDACRATVIGSLNGKVGGGRDEIDLEDYRDRADGETLEYVVVDEHTLGYLYKSGKYFSVGVLASSATRGGRDWKNGPFPVATGSETIRKASKADFESYRVSSDGYEDLV